MKPDTSLCRPQSVRVLNSVAGVDHERAVIALQWNLHFHRPCRTMQRADQCRVESQPGAGPMEALRFPIQQGAPARRGRAGVEMEGIETPLTFDDLSFRLG